MQDLVDGPADSPFWRHVNDQLGAKTTQLLRAINWCLDDGLWEPALILLFAGVDAFSWLDRPEERDDSTGADFERWVEEYLLPDSGLECSGEEMWGARCGMLHSHTSESRLYRQKRIRRLEYVRGGGRGQPALVALGIAEDSLPVRVDLDRLMTAFRRAVGRFAETIDADEIKGGLVARRVGASYLSRGYLFPPSQREDDEGQQVPAG